MKKSIETKRSKQEEEREMWTIIFLAAAVLFAIGCLKWKVSTLALIYYMEKNRHRLPNDEEMKECTGFVVKNMIKDLSRRSGNR